MTEIKRWCKYGETYPGDDGQMFEDPQGEWVRWEDVCHALESHESNLDEKDDMITDVIARCREVIEQLLLARMK